MLLGHIYTHAKEYDQARAAYLNSIEVQSKYDPTAEKDNIILVNPDSRATAFYGLGLLAEIAENYTEARGYYNKTIEQNPDYLDVWREKGDVLVKLGKYDEARKCFDISQRRQEG